MVTKASETVYLVDTSFFIFRAYHALPPLTTSEGVPTNVVHGVATMFERLMRTEEPAYLAAVFDTARKTFRNDIYPEYKANRDEPEEDLKVQFPLVRRLVEAMAIYQIEQAGYEADDLIATLAKRFYDEGKSVVIVTGDKDMMQCVRDGVSLYDPMKNVRVRHKQVLEKFGVAPEQVADVLGLMGDASDNFPGVRGIGPKTASALIAHFGSLDAMFERSAEIESMDLRGAKGIRKKIEEGVEMAKLCRRLATVADEVEIDTKLEELKVRSADAAAMSALSAELELRQLAKRLGVQESDIQAAENAAGKSEPKAAGKKPRKAGSAQGELLGPEGPKASGDLAKLRGKPVVFVCEEGGGATLLCAAAGKSRVVVRGRDQAAACLKDLAGSGSSFAGYDLKLLAREFAIDIGGEGLDLSVASYLVDASGGGHGPNELCGRFLEEERVAPIADASEAEAALAQVDRLRSALGAELAARGQESLYRELEHPLIGVLGRIEAAGILLDTKLLADMSKDLELRMEKLVAEVYAAAGESFNILSPLQLRQILFEKLALPKKGIKKTKTGPSTDSESLETLAPLHPLPRLVLDYRGLAKLKSTYVDTLPRQVDDDSRIHTTLHQTVTATGRLSSSDPNLQNIPIRTEEGKLIRGAFVAPQGSLLISADYNQIELRVLAHLSRDEALIQAFTEGEDIHAKTAREVFDVGKDAVSPELRRQAKVINFGIIYGMGPVRLSRELGITRNQASDYIKRYFDRYPGVQAFYETMLEHAREHGWVSTLMGRRRYLPDIASDHGGQRQFAERVATNTPIQGSAADIIKVAMVGLDARLAAEVPGARMVLQIHDELLVECKKSQEKQVLEVTRGVMEEAVELLVPVVVDIRAGKSWAEAH